MHTLARRFSRHSDSGRAKRTRQHRARSQVGSSSVHPGKQNYFFLDPDLFFASPTFFRTPNEYIFQRQELSDLAKIFYDHISHSHYFHSVKRYLSSIKAKQKDCSVEKVIWFEDGGHGACLFGMGAAELANRRKIIDSIHALESSPQKCTPTASA